MGSLRVMFAVLVVSVFVLQQIEAMTYEDYRAEKEQRLADMTEDEYFDYYFVSRNIFILQIDTCTRNEQ